MTGAEVILQTAKDAGVKICFANAGTTELPLVAAFDKVSGIRPVLGLFEGVCTGAADGYGRVTQKPAMTLLHLGPGFANGIANLHNASSSRMGENKIIWKGLQSRALPHGQSPIQRIMKLNAGFCIGPNSIRRSISLTNLIPLTVTLFSSGGFKILALIRHRLIKNRFKILNCPSRRWMIIKIFLLRLNRLTRNIHSSANKKQPSPTLRNTIIRSIQVPHLNFVSSILKICNDLLHHRTARHFLQIRNIFSTNYFWLVLHHIFYEHLVQLPTLRTKTTLRTA